MDVGDARAAILRRLAELRLPFPAVALARPRHQYLTGAGSRNEGVRRLGPAIARRIHDFFQNPDPNDTVVQGG